MSFLFLFLSFISRKQGGNYLSPRATDLVGTEHNIQAGFREYYIVCTDILDRSLKRLVENIVDFSFRVVLNIINKKG